MSKYCPPQYGNTGFHCPYCQVYADQTWREVTWQEELIDESDDYNEIYDLLPDTAKEAIEKRDGKTD